MDLSTNFGRNPINVNGVMIDHLRKIRLNVCHAHRVNPSEEWVENYYVVGVTIIGMSFCDLKGVQIKTMDMWHTTHPVSQLYDRFL